MLRLVALATRHVRCLHAKSSLLCATRMHAQVTHMVPNLCLLYATCCSQQVAAGYRLPQPDGCDDLLYSLLASCWHEEPSQRPNMHKILEVRTPTWLCRLCLQLHRPQTGVDGR